MEAIYEFLPNFMNMIIYMVVFYKKQTPVYTGALFIRFHWSVPVKEVFRA